MKNGLLLMLAGAACAALATGAIAADGKAPAKSPAKVTKTAYKAPLAADGHPDLEGVWNNSSMTPL